MESFLTGVELAVIELFVSPLSVLSQETGYSERLLQPIWINLETLTCFQQDFLEALGAADNVGQVFLRFGDYFKMYTQYVSGYDRCLQTMQALQYRTRFTRVVKKTQEALSSGQWPDLLSHLIMPVQRVPRYVLLLRPSVGISVGFPPACA